MRAGDDCCLAHAGDAAGGGNGGGGDAKERHVDCVGGAVVLVRGVPESLAVAQQFYHLPNLLPVYGAFHVITATFIDQTIYDRVVVGAIDGVEVQHIAKQARPYINGIKMHAEQQNSLAIGVSPLDMLHAFNGQPFVQVDTVVAEAACHFQNGFTGAGHATAGQCFLLRRVQFRETEPDVGLHNMSAFFG